MSAWETIKSGLKKHKKKIIIGGSTVLTLVGAGVGYVLYQNGKVSFPDWLKSASTQELREEHDKMLPIFHEKGVKPFEMEQISRELGIRESKDWLTKHPPNPGYVWNDEARWDRS